MNLKQISSVRNMPVLDLESGMVLGRVANWIINPRDQRLMALLLEKTGLFQKWSVIVPADIVEYGPRMIVARNREAIIAAHEVVGLNELIKKRSHVVGLKAETDKGRGLGVVNDFIFDAISSRINKYFIRPLGLTSLIRHDLILSADKVVAIEKNRLVFSDNLPQVASGTDEKQERATQRV